MPRSRATWRAEWPSTVTSRTASALNSSVNARRMLTIHHLRSDHTELAEVSARAGEDQSLGPPPWCGGPDPLLRQVKIEGNRQAAPVIGQGQRHGDLAVILLAQLAAVLARHADRVGSFLGKAGVVEDPGGDRA